MFTNSKKLPIDKELLISLVSGSEAGIATTAAILVGLVISTDNRSLVLLSSLIAVLVQAFNSAITSILANHTKDEIEHKKTMDSLIAPITRSGLQFLTHVSTGMIIMLPIVYITNIHYAMLVSVVIALSLLLVTGFLIGKTVKHTPIRNSVQSFVLGAIIICIGFVAGYIIN